MTGKPQFFPTITRFDRDHPDFSLYDPPNDPVTTSRRPLTDMKTKDPGKLKFNHSLHLTPGMGTGWKLTNISDPAVRGRYHEGPDGVQLNCASCHVLGGGDLFAYMAPIAYETNCRACHPLTFDPQLPALTIPHGLQPQEVTDYLRGVYAREELRTKTLGVQKRTGWAMPGTDKTAPAKDSRQEIEVKLTNAEEIVFLGKQTCGECHIYKGQQEHIVPNAILPPQVPKIWFRHAVFSHLAHRALDCLACHQEATKSVENADILLPSMKSCTPCHSPAGYRDGKMQGGAQFDCTECHRYHHPDNRSEGSATVQGGGSAPRSIDNFLSGKP
jgi:hypothetical protein